jgi:hypothetical protein
MSKVKGSSFPWLGNLCTYLSWLVVEKTFQFMWFKTDVKLRTKLCFVGYYCHSVFIDILLIPFYVKSLANYGSFHTNSTCASCRTGMKSSKKYSIPLPAWYGKEKKTDWYQDQYGMFKSWYEFPTLRWNPKCVSSFHFSWKALNLKC